MGWRSLRAVDGQVESFISFERDVLQRISRTVTSVTGSHEPASVNDNSLSAPLHALAVFEHA